jgi:hypothetical protein
LVIVASNFGIDKASEISSGYIYHAMLRFTSSALLLLLLGGGVAAPDTVEVNADGSTSTPTTDEKPPIVECGVYMAPSTLGEKTNMGIYTGKLLQPNEVINYPEIAIPLLFREWGAHKPGFIGKKSHCFYMNHGGVGA